MSAARTTTTLPVFLTPYSAHRSSDLHALPAAELASAVHINSFCCDDWTQVGVAEVTILLAPHAEVVSAQVAALRAEQSKLRAEAEQGAMRLEQKIQSLLAIEHTVAA